MARLIRINNKIIEVANHSKMNFKHGCVLTKGSSKPMITGENIARTKYLNYIDYCLHSELNSALKLIKQIKKQKTKDKDIKRVISKYIIWVGRINKDNLLTNSKPCMVCKYRLLKLGFKKVAYTNDNGNLVKCNICDLNTNHLSECQLNLKKLCLVF